MAKYRQLADILKRILYTGDELHRCIIREGYCVVHSDDDDEMYVQDLLEADLRNLVQRGFELIGQEVDWKVLEEDCKAIGRELSEETDSLG